MPLRRVPPAGVWQVDLNFAKTTPITNQVRLQVRRRGVQHLQQPDVRRARSTSGTRVGRLRPHQPQHDRPEQLPALRAARVPSGVLSGLDTTTVARCDGRASARYSPGLIDSPARHLPCSPSLPAPVVCAAPQRSTPRSSGRGASPGRTSRRSRPRSHAAGVTAGSFDAYVAGVAAENARRVREGDLDHLVYYLLQSHASPSAGHRAGAERRAARRRPDADRRAASCAATPPRAAAAADVSPHRRAARAVEAPRGDARLAYFRALARRRRSRPRGAPAQILRREYTARDALPLPEGVRRPAGRPTRPPPSPSCIAAAASAPTRRSRPATSSISAWAC